MSRGLGDVYKRQGEDRPLCDVAIGVAGAGEILLTPTAVDPADLGCGGAALDAIGQLGQRQWGLSLIHI